MDNDSSLVLSDPIDAIWLQMEGEPDEWYERFSTYYLQLGPSRNLTRAYVRYLASENPEQAAIVLSKPHYVNTPQKWSEIARVWNWRDRAEAFDLFTASENYAFVERARNYLMRSTEAAAETLVKNLDNPRHAVAAAKEILDRGGVPGARVVGVGRIDPYTADDLKRAEQALIEWEERIRGGRIIDADADGDDGTDVGSQD